MGDSNPTFYNISLRQIRPNLALQTYIPDQAILSLYASSLPSSLSSSSSTSSISFDRNEESKQKYLLELGNHLYTGIKRHGMYFFSMKSASNLQQDEKDEKDDYPSHSTDLLLLLLHAEAGWRAHFISPSTWTIQFILDLSPAHPKSLGLQGLRSPTLFLDSISAVISTILWNHMNCLHSLPEFVQQEHISPFLLSPLLRNGFPSFWKERIATELIGGEYRLAEFEVMMEDLNLMELPTESKAGMSGKSATSMACKMSFGKLLTKLSSSTQSIHSVKGTEEMRKMMMLPTTTTTTTTTNMDNLKSELSDQDRAIFQVVKMPRLLTEANPQVSFTRILYHLIVDVLQYHSHHVHKVDESSVRGRYT